MHNTGDNSWSRCSAKAATLYCWHLQSDWRVAVTWLPHLFTCPARLQFYSWLWFGLLLLWIIKSENSLRAAGWAAVSDSAAGALEPVLPLFGFPSAKHALPPAPVPLMQPPALSQLQVAENILHSTCWSKLYNNMIALMITVKFFCKKRICFPRGEDWELIFVLALSEHIKCLYNIIVPYTIV